MPNITATSEPLLDDLDGVHAAAIAELPPLASILRIRLAALVRSGGTK